MNWTQPPVTASTQDRRKNGSNTNSIPIPPQQYLPSQSPPTDAHTDQNNITTSITSYKDGQSTPTLVKRSSTCPPPKWSESSRGFSDQQQQDAVHQLNRPEAVGEVTTDFSTKATSTSIRNDQTRADLRSQSKTTPVSPVDSQTVSISNFKSADPSPKPSSQAAQTRPGLKSATGGIRRLASEGQKSVQRYHISVPASVMKDPEKKAQVQSTQNVDSRRLSNSAIITEEVESPSTYERGDAMKETFKEPAQQERSVSRGRSHMEKSIEATVKKPETGLHARSRKASHMLGIFDPQVAKKSQTKGQDIEQAQSEASSSRSRPGTPISPASSTAQEAFQHIQQQTDYFSKPKRRLESPDQSIAPHENGPIDRISKGSAIAISGSVRDDDRTPRPQFPTGLLQDIRSAPLQRPVALRHKASTPGVPTIDNEDHDDNPRAIESPEDHEVTHEDEEEHISAAVYYPHEGPSADEIEEYDHHDLIITTSDQSLRRDSITRKSASSISSQASDIHTSQLPVEEHIDISVVSKYEKTAFHGTLKSEDDEDEADVQTPRMPAVDEKQDLKSTLASDSELDSSDELVDSSQTDNGIVTPVAKSPRKTRSRAGTLTKPKNAVTLAPYKHQVGGHSTIFRFSRRAVCKQLNNRENEFYERIERTHPDMLKFLPRYIGVLNVTFSKGPKQDSNGNKDDKEVQPKDLDDNIRQSTEEGTKNIPEDDIRSTSHASDHDLLRHQRIVSHSQQIGTIPQVLLNQNRHILPSEYFGLPERPKSADPTHFRQRKSDFRPSGSLLSSGLSQESKQSSPSPSRPPPPEHSPSWGTTSVNVPLKDKVLREVFGPPPIKHRKRHTHSHHTHNTIPIRKDSDGRRRANMSLPVLDQNGDQHGRQVRRAHSMHQSDNVDEDGTNPSHLSLPHTANDYSNFPPKQEDCLYDLARVKTVDSNDTDVTEENGRPVVRRRHSGMGLRRRRRSLSGNEKPNLEYFEDEALSVMKESEVFAMDEDVKKQIEAFAEPVESTSADQQQDKNYVNGIIPAVTESEAGSEAGQDGDEQEMVPINPREAQEVQSTSADQRVAYFILLEDLTAGMGRPCVLDLKMGTRQYGVEANEKKMESQRKKCRETTSQQMGVRICGMQTYNRKTKETSYEDKYFGRSLKAGKEFREALVRFLYDGVSYESVQSHIPTILHKIARLESMVRKLPGYRFYASSLLMFYDAEPEKSRDFFEAQKHGIDYAKQRKAEDKKWPLPIELRLVDFANCITAEDSLPKDTKAPPVHPQDIDRGYLRGLRSLKRSFERIEKDIQEGKLTEIKEGKDAGRLKEKENQRSVVEAEFNVQHDSDEGEVSI